jgi:hypothetical protein
MAQQGCEGSGKVRLAISDYSKDKSNPQFQYVHAVCFIFSSLPSLLTNAANMSLEEDGGDEEDVSEDKED